MYSEKVLIDWSEYQRLKSYEKKYIQLKKQQDKYASVGEQSGQGREDNLEKIILSNENENENVPKKQEILAPLTTPEVPKDIESPLPPKIGGAAGGSLAEEREQSVKEKKRKRKRRPSVDREPASKWFYIGVPKYKH